MSMSMKRRQSSASVSLHRWFAVRTIQSCTARIRAADSRGARAANVSKTIADSCSLLGEPRRASYTTSWK